MEKSHFNLSMGQFLFSKYKILKGFHLLNGACWVFDQRSLNFKKNTNISLISFQQLDFEIWELIPEQERLSNKKSTDRVCKILTEVTSILLDTSWKVEQLGAIQWTWEGKQAVFRSTRGKKNMIKWWISEIEDNVVQRKIIRWTSTGGKSINGWLAI
jgi:hypothetical protein